MPNAFQAYQQAKQQAFGRGVQMEQLDLARRKMEMAGQGGDSPSTVREWQYYNQLGPEDQKRFLTMKRAAQYQDIGGVPTQFIGREGKPLSTLEKEAAGQARIARERTAAVKSEEIKSKLLGMEPKARMSAKMVKQQTQFVSNTIDKAIGQISPLTAGPGALTAGVPGTPAKNLRETLNTIRANIGFDRLQQMRAASPTGGALGQVSEMENKLLQAVWGSLEQSQSPSQLRENLKKAKITIQESWERTAAAYEQDYGKPMEDTPLDETTGAKAGQIKKLGNKTYVNINGQWFEQ